MVLAECGQYFARTAADSAAYTLTHGAVEAAAPGCYVMDPDIDGRERVRRTMNYQPDALCERMWLFRGHAGRVRS